MPKTIVRFSSTCYTRFGYFIGRGTNKIKSDEYLTYYDKIKNIIFERRRIINERGVITLINIYSNDHVIDFKHDVIGKGGDRFRSGNTIYWDEIINYLHNSGLIKKKN